MSVISKPPIEYYYDSHLTEEDLMGYNALQARLATYILALLRWMFRGEGWFIALDLNIYLTPAPDEVPTVPDVAVYKGVVLDEEQEARVLSWRIDPPEAPPPAVVFEVASKDTWQKDLNDKPEIYARMGVREYVYLDARLKRPAGSPGLRVWRMADGRAIELPADESGRVWSDELQSWLVPEAGWLRLYERSGLMRLTGEETERAAKEVERELKERAWAALRKLGVDPENLPAARE
ncbi:MAG TPA: Uma2 family endonuclease [Armatimonadota bacterium]|nr:Uma2 family endonuclease [Armatimonadota bacterium]